MDYSDILPTTARRLVDVPIALTDGNVDLILAFRRKNAVLFDAITKHDRREAERLQKQLRAEMKEVEIDAPRGMRYYYNFFILTQCLSKGDTYDDIQRKVYRSYIPETFDQDGSKRECCCGKKHVEWMGFVQLPHGQLLLGSECILRYKLADKRVLASEKRARKASAARESDESDDELVCGLCRGRQWIFPPPGESKFVSCPDCT